MRRSIFYGKGGLRVKNKITTNISLKIISLFLAFLLWMVINNASDPTIDKTFTDIPVKLLNTELITDSGQVYEVLEDSTVIDKVTVWAPRSVFSNLSASNIIATADVSELSSLDTIGIKLTTNLGSEVERIQGSSDTVKLNIENMRTKTLALKTTVQGEVESGYLVGEVTTDQNLVRISGPESVINKISKASVDMDVTGFTSDIGTNAEIRLYDSDDKLIQDSRVSQNIKTVGIKVSIYQTMEVPVIFGYTGTPAPGYRVTGEIESSAGTVVLAGKSKVISGVNQIEVPAEMIDISGRTEDYEEEIDIRPYLPENVFLADTQQARINVAVRIRREVSRRIAIREEQVSVVNVPEGYTATISELGENSVIEIVGLSEEIAEISAGNIEGKVDIAQWMREEGMEEPEEGFYQVEIDFGLPDNVRITQSITVVMHLSKMEE